MESEIPDRNNYRKIRVPRPQRMELIKIDFFYDRVSIEKSILHDRNDRCTT